MLISLKIRGELVAAVTYFIGQTFFWYGYGHSHPIYVLTVLCYLPVCKGHVNFVDVLGVGASQGGRCPAVEASVEREDREVGRAGTLNHFKINVKVRLDCKFSPAS